MKLGKRQRQNSLFDRSHLYRFIAIFLIQSTTIVCFVAIPLFVPDMVDMVNEELSMEVRGIAAQRILSLHSRVWPAVIALVCLLGIHSMWISYRFIKNLYRFRQVFDKIGKGDLSQRLKLRKKDYLYREEAVFNEMIDVFTEKWKDLRTGILEALKSLDSLEQGVTKTSGWRDTDQQLLRKHRQLIESLADHSQYFSLRKV